MFIENLAELSLCVFKKGFGRLLEDAAFLESLDSRPAGDFSLEVNDEFDGKSRLNTRLYFVREPRSSIYSLSNFTSTLYYGDGLGHSRSHSFDIGRFGITHREAYNLLSGRSVYAKESGDADGVHCAWVRLDFQAVDMQGNFRMVRYSDLYGYNVERFLDLYPIEELGDPRLRQHIVLSLKKGNLHLVTFVVNGKRKKMVIEACPADNTLVIHPLGFGIVEAGEVKNMRGRKGKVTEDEHVEGCDFLAYYGEFSDAEAAMVVLNVGGPRKHGGSVGRVSDFVFLNPGRKPPVAIFC